MTESTILHRISRLSSPSLKDNALAQDMLAELCRQLEENHGKKYAVQFPVGVRNLTLVAIDGDVARMVDAFSDDPITVDVASIIGPAE